MMAAAFSHFPVFICPLFLDIIQQADGQLMPKGFKPFPVRGIGQDACTISFLGT